MLCFHIVFRSAPGRENVRQTPTEIPAANHRRALQTRCQETLGLRNVPDRRRPKSCDTMCDTRPRALTMPEKRMGPPPEPSTDGSQTTNSVTNT